MLRITSQSVNVLAYAFGLVLFLPVVSLNFFAGGGWLDVNEYLFVPPIVGSFALFSYSFFTLRANIVLKIVLNLSMGMSEILGIPNIVYPIGSQWWESISLGFGLVSSCFIAFNLMLFSLVYAHKALINKPGQLRT